MDAAAFAAASEQIDTGTGCLAVPVDVGVAASVHEHGALRAFFDRDPAATVAAFRAARSASPGYRPAPDIAPAGGPLWQRYAAADGAPGPVVSAVPRWSGAQLFVDGRPLDVRPTDRPALLQAVGPDGAVLASVMHRPEQAPPAWVVAPPLPAPTEPVPRRRHVPWFVAAGVSAGVSGGLAIAGFTARHGYMGAFDAAEAADDARPLTQRALDRQAAVANGYGYGAQIGLGVTGGLLLTGLVVR